MSKSLELKMRVSAEVEEVKDDKIKIGIYLDGRLSTYLYFDKESLLPQFEEKKDDVKGVVKWFHAEKGYGFISYNEGRDDIFVHFSGIVCEGFKNLEENEEVIFNIGQGSRCQTAINVRKISQ